jgi:WD40 repeat protein
VYIIFLSAQHQFLTVAGDNSITSWSISCEEEDGRFYLSQQKRYHLSDSGKTITSCCLSSLRGYLFLGVEGGNVYRLDLKSFELADNMIFWNNATALAQPAAQTHPGAVRSLEISPANPNMVKQRYLWQPCGDIIDVF